LPKSLVEAAACGRAVVTTDVPGCRDAIMPDVTGLLVSVKDAIALANAIQTLIEDPELRNKMGQAGRALAEEAFAIEKIVEQHMDIYRELLEP
jgi:glycosyltransferase involved in cell wall biosynthesis